MSVAPRSGLLDTDTPIQEKLYGYHRLDNPLLVLRDDDTDEFFTLSYTEYSSAKEQQKRSQAELLPMLNTPEAKRY